MAQTIVTPSFTPQPKKIGQRRRWIFILVTVVAISGLCGSAYFYFQYRNIKTNPDQVAIKEVKKVVAMVGKLMVLPVNEIPTVATISDKSKLADQAFFKTAMNGDKLLVYTSASTAILYRPTINKIINVSPLTDDETAASVSPTTNTKTESQGTTNTNKSR